MRRVSMARNCLVATLVAGLLGLVGVDAAPAGTPLAAVWKEQHLDFVYLGRTVRYSCEGLRNKLRAMLLDLGARRDAHVLPGCDTPEGDSGVAGPRLSVVFSSPALPDAGATPAHEGDRASIDAAFVPFTITSDAFRNMGAGDCELVQEFARQVLPRLATRKVAQRINCARSPQAGSRFWVRGEVLKAVPPTDTGVDRVVRERWTPGRQPEPVWRRAGRVSMP